MEHDQTVGSHKNRKAEALPAKQATSYQKNCHAPRLVNAVIKHMADYKLMYADQSRLEKDQSSRDKKEASVWTKIADSFMEDESDDELDDVHGPAEDLLEYDYELKPHYKDRGVYLKGVNRVERGNRLRTVLSGSILAEIRKSKNNFLVSGNGDQFLDDHSTVRSEYDDKPWDELSEEEKAGMIDSAGSSLLDKYLSGGWLKYCYRRLAFYGLLTVAFSAMSMGKHGHGQEWDFNPGAGGTQSSPPTKTTKSDALAAIMSASGQLVKAANSTPAVPPVNDGAASAQESLLKSDLAGKQTVELAMILGKLTATDTEVQNTVMKTIWAARGRQLLAANTSNMDAATIDFMMNAINDAMGT